MIESMSDKRRAIDTRRPVRRQGFIVDARVTIANANESTIPVTHGSYGKPVEGGSTFPSWLPGHINVAPSLSGSAIPDGNSTGIDRTHSLVDRPTFDDDCTARRAPHIRRVHARCPNPRRERTELTDELQRTGRPPQTLTVEVSLMISDRDYVSTIPRCPSCGQILGEHTRLERGRRECRRCRRVWKANEVFVR